MSLQATFSNFEGDFGPAFDKDILESLRKPFWRRNYMFWPVIGILIILTIGSALVFSLSGTKKTAQKANTMASSHLRTDNGYTTLAGSKKAKNIKPQIGSDAGQIKLIDTASLPSVGISQLHQKIIVSKVSKSSILFQDTTSQRTVPTSMESSGTYNKNRFQLEPMIDDSVALSLPSSNLSYQAAGKLDSTSNIEVLPMIENRNVAPPFRAPDLPIIKGYGKTAQNARVAVNNRYKIVLSLMPTKVNFGLFIRPAENSRIQDVSLLKSSLSVGIKVSAGLEIRNAQFLLAYSHLNRRIGYETGIEKFTANETSPGEYVIKRLGDRREVRMPGHMLGIGVKRMFYFNFLQKHALFASVGGDYMRALRPAGGNQIQVNFILGRSFALNSKSVFTIGPYLEYGITKQAFVNGQMRVRQYQYGISLGLKLAKPPLFVP